LSAKDERDMDRLADQVAEGRALPLAASRCGMSIMRAEFLWRRITIRLGRQALD
jgi:hypothetical protein